MPKTLMSDIRTGSVELEDQSIDLEDLDKSYEEDLDKDEYKTNDQQPGQAEPALGGVPNGPQPAPTM
jgi:hypothetical protein